MATGWTSRTPFTYEIGYERDHIGNPEFTKLVAAGRPGLLHTGHDVPLNSATGNTIQFNPEDMRYISPEELPARIEELKGFVREMKQAGAEMVIPYIITMVIIGNPTTRTGFWQLYDRWEEYAQFGLGPKPETDPIHWLQSGPRPMHVPGVFAYETTISHPAVQRFLKVCVDLVAQCGYDGTFLDVNTMVGFSETDRQWFARYLRMRYTAEELSQLFAFSSEQDILLGHPGDGLLWVETQRFRAWAFGQLYATLTEAGRAHVPHFFVVPNLSPMSSIDIVYRRRNVGHTPTYTRAGCDMFMYEIMQQPGRFGVDRISSNTIEYKYALAHDVQGVVLLYYAGDRNGISLANAEAAAGGGGAFVQPGFREAETMRFWGEWFKRHRDRYDGLSSLHDVGIVFLADEMYWDNRPHVEAVYRLSQALSENHVLFDFIVDPAMAPDILRSFAAVIVPEAQHLSEAAMASLLRYAERGGRVIVVGRSGVSDEQGNKHGKTLREELAPTGKVMLWVDAVDALVPVRGKELFDLTEEQYNDMEIITALPDRVSSPQEAQEARNVPLVTALEVLTGRSLRFLSEGAPYTLRTTAFSDPTEHRTMVHLVNYDLPILGKQKSGTPIPAHDIRIRMPAKSARWWTPDGIDGEPLSVVGGEVTVPEVSIYAMVELHPE